MKKVNAFFLTALVLGACIACSSKEDEGGTAVTTKPANVNVEMSGESNAPKADQGTASTAPPPAGP